MSSVNKELAEDNIRHAIDFDRYSNSVVRRMIALLNRADPEIFAALQEALDRLPASSFTVERLDSLLLSARQLNALLYARVENDMGVELRHVVSLEGDYQAGAFKSTLPEAVQVKFPVAAIDVQSVYSAAMSRPFQGVLLSEALSGLEQSRAKLIRDTIRIGYVSAQTTDQIVQKLRGTRTRGYADGLMEAPRRNLESIVRTALSHTAASTREAFVQKNDDLIKAVMWHSTIDLRTSSPCRLRDGLQYTPQAHKPIGHSYPWGAGPGKFHWCCRSTSVVVTRSWRELGISIDDMSSSSRASMDGQIAGDTTYAQWLERQSAARQDEVLGPERGALLRQGGLKMEDMYNSKGKYLSLDEIRARDSRAFERLAV